MERKAMLAMLVHSIRSNAREIGAVLEELNRGAREATYPHTLTRCFRTIEHDARVVSLERFADLARDAKLASERVLDPRAGPAVVEVLAEAVAECVKAAAALEAGQRHKLDEALVAKLSDAAKPGAEARRRRETDPAFG